MLYIAPTLDLAWLFTLAGFCHVISNVITLPTVRLTGLHHSQDDNCPASSFILLKAQRGGQSHPAGSNKHRGAVQSSASYYSLPQTRRGKAEQIKDDRIIKSLIIFLNSFLLDICFLNSVFNTSFPSFDGRQHDIGNLKERRELVFNFIFYISSFHRMTLKLFKSKLNTLMWHVECRRCLTCHFCTVQEDGGWYCLSTH